MIFFTAIELSSCKSFKFSKKKYDIIKKGTEFSRKFTIETIFSFMTIRFRSIQMSDHFYMRIFFYNANLSANPIQSIFFLFFSALIAFFLSRFVKFFASVYRVDAHVDNFVHFSKCTISQFLLTNIYRILSKSKGLTKLRGSRVNIDFKHIEQRKHRATVFKKFLCIFIILDFACVVTDQFDFKFKPLNVNLDFSFFFQVQNSDEMMPHFFCDLITITDGHFVDR